MVTPANRLPKKVIGSLIIAKEIEKRVPAINQSTLFLFVVVDN
jgi:hypothetical protein